MIKSLLESLQEADEALLYALSHIWDVSLMEIPKEQHKRVITGAMLNPQNAEKVWGKLSEKARQAIQTLVAGKGGYMLTKQFEAIFGKLEKTGRAKVQEELKSPKTITSELYYRGILASGFTNATNNQDIHPVYYVPEDLVKALPLHKTQYEHLKDEIAEEIALLGGHDSEIKPLEALDDDEIEGIVMANTSIVDDMTTLLAYLRLHSAGVEGDSFLPVDSERILPHLFNPSAERLTFMLCVGVSAELIDVQEGRAHPQRQSLNWLKLSRPEQIKTLAEAWGKSVIYQDIWHVEGLHPEAGFEYDATLARSVLMSFLRKTAPTNPKAWWDVEQFINTIKRHEPHFQRPNADYERWYIRNTQGEFLRGFESWEAVEGALIEFLLQNPLHWLGLCDIAEDAVRLNAYGRGMIGIIPFPLQPDTPEKITVLPDNTVLVSRKFNRQDRYTIARFSEWVSHEDLFTYRITPKSLATAQEQGITNDKIEAFLKRHADAPLPQSLLRQLSLTQSGTLGHVSLEQVTVLHTTSSEMLDRIFNDPTLRRYLGARLGETTVIVRESQSTELANALAQVGFKVDSL